jgi:hypothetical protein
MKVSAKSKERVLAPEGVHAARCVRILDLGTQFSERFQTSARKVQLSFELVNETHVFNEEEGEQPFVLHRKYTASLNKRASLAKDIQAWTGKKLDKNAEFDLDELLGQACQVQVTHDESDNGEVYANIQTIMAAPKGAKVKAAATPLTTLSLESGEFDQDVFDELPEFLQEIIQETPEYQELNKGKKKTARKAEDEEEADEEEEAPKAPRKAIKKKK